MSLTNEHAVIQGIKQGNSELYAELVRAHQARVRLACLVWLGNADEANDAAQDVFIKAFTSLARFKEDSLFLTWILRIADNHCRDMLRSRTWQRTDSLDSLLAEKGDALESLLSRAQSHTGQVAYDPQDLELLGRLFSALPSEDREILVLSEVEGLAYKDMAERLACSLDAVKGRLKRARQALVDKCAKYFPDTFQPSTRL